MDYTRAMKTDQPIYQFLATGAEAFRVLTGGLTLAGPYRFRSLTLKVLERRIDGVFEPEGHDGPVYLLEFQGQLVKTAWYNLMSKVGLYGEAHPQWEVRGILVFLHSDLDPRYPPGMRNRKSGPFRAVYLNRFLPAWLAREPDNPYLAVFAPLVLSAKRLRQQAPRLWQTIQQAPVAPETRATLSEILAFWFFERFKSLTKQEIWTMLNVLTPLEETRAYQEIFAEGEAEGEAEGRAEGEARGKVKGKIEGKIEGKIDDLKRLLTRRFGPVPEWAVQRIEGASLEQLDVWLEGLLDAESLGSLLDNGSH
jgi:predicted transposase YdaD